jgi:acyl carrier protein phosphodiesterase
MNFLAHSFLSFSDEQIVGQFLNDFIPNKDRFSVPKPVLQGIILHREIDSFTDNHPVIHQAKKLFSPLVRLYSGAFVDVAMDYFLAHDTQIHQPEQWKTHSQKVYAALNNHIDLFPNNFAPMLQKMESEDWLYNYREDWGIQFSMKNVLNKAKYLDKNIPVFEIFLQEKEQLNGYYQEFFPDLQEYISKVNAGF